MKKHILFLTVAVLLSGCISSSIPNHRYKVNTKPYTIAGKTYYPMATADGFTQTGIASWYGPSFHGKKTASGERYNQNAMTAAHKTLPFGTILRVTNLRNNRSTTVVVNDRGPFVDNRIIDLSNAAAKQLDMIGTGTAKVRLKSIGSTNTSVAKTKSFSTAPAKASYSSVSTTSKTGGYYVQIGAFSARENANSAAQSLSNMGYRRVVKQNDSGRFVVQAGPYSSRSAAESARDKLRKTYSGAFIAN